MHTFDGFIFLDPPKTGTTFVSQVLSEFGHEVSFLKHKPPRAADIARQPLIFSTVRDPFDFYRSTYAYGSRKDGGGRKSLYRAFGKERVAALLDTQTNANFNEWLRLFLELQDIGDHEFVPTPAWRNVGRFTYRFFKMALKDAGRITPTSALLTDKISEMLPRYFIRTDHLRDDFASLIEGPLAPHLTDPAAAVREVFRMAPKNVSPRPPLAFEPKLKARVQDREAPMFCLWESLLADPRTGLVESSLRHQ